MMHDEDMAKTPEERMHARDIDAAEMLGMQTCAVASLPPYRNGPACYLSINPDHPSPPTGCFIVGPCAGYDELVVMADWTMSNTVHTACFNIWQAMDPDYRMRDTDREDPPGMVPFLDQADPQRSSWIVAPTKMSHENCVILRFRDVIATHIGMRLTTWPRRARLEARIWVLMIRNGKDGR
jgi:hypothetical protein